MNPAAKVRGRNEMADRWLTEYPPEQEEGLTNRRFGCAAPPRPPNPPRRASTSAARAAGLHTFITADIASDSRRPF